MKKFIAERRILYASKGSNDKKEAFVRINSPYSVQEGTVNFTVGEEGVWACHIELEGLEERCSEVYYGADSLQAIQFASDVEPFLKRLQKKYDLFFSCGEPYFDDPE